MNLYASFHFAQEEELFSRTGFPGAEAHRREHQVFAAAVGEFFQDFQKRASDALPRQVLVYMKNWLLEHSIGADRAFADYLKALPGPADAGTAH